MWSLDPDLHHLNHGSFGAVPVPVQEVRAQWLRRSESRPTAFVIEELQEALDRAREEVAGFVGASLAGTVFVRNATTGVASVVRSFEPRLRPGDQLVTTSHDYNAVRQTLEFSAGRAGAEVLTASIPFPIADPAEVVEAVLGSVGPRTRLVVLDHITSPTALVFPIEELVSALEPDIPVLVDGAHGPGQVPLDLEELGASWYTGNLHKWVCAPKGAGFLHTRADRVEETFPVVISHGWNASLRDGASRYHSLFDWLGTDDFSPWLAAPDAIRTVGGLEPGGWPEIMELNHQLALAARRLLCSALGVDPPAPEIMVGSMASIPLPDLVEAAVSGGLSPLNRRLIDRGLESLVMVWPEWPRQLIRVSAHRYNTIEEYRRLAEVVSELVA
jgi:isopenicillin-N epimerase